MAIEIHAKTSAHRPEALLDEKLRKGLKRVTLAVKDGCLTDMLILESLANAIEKPKGKFTKQLFDDLKNQHTKAAIQFAEERDKGLTA